MTKLSNLFNDLLLEGEVLIQAAYEDDCVFYEGDADQLANDRELIAEELWDCRVTYIAANAANQIVIEVEEE